MRPSGKRTPTINAGVTPCSISGCASESTSACRSPVRAYRFASASVGSNSVCDIAPQALSRRQTANPATMREQARHLLLQNLLGSVGGTSEREIDVDEICVVVSIKHHIIVVDGGIGESIRR